MSNDLSAGTLVLGMDYPDSQTGSNSTATGNISSTSYTADSTECTFIAPTTGRVMVNIGGECRDNSSTNFVRLSVSIVDNRTGAEVVGTDAYARGVSSVGSSASDYGTYSKSFLVQGLEPGYEYTATVYYRVSGGTSADKDTVGLLVWPAT